MPRSSLCTHALLVLFCVACSQDSPEGGGGFWSRIFGSAGRGAVIGGIAGGLAVLLLGLFKWLRRGKS